MPISVNAFDCAVSMVRGWGGEKHRLLTQLRLNTLANPGAQAPGSFVPLSFNFLAQATGIDRRAVARHLGELVSVKVLERVVPGAGRRAHAYAPNPDVRAWAVSWGVDREAALFRIAVVNGDLRPAPTGFVARSSAPLLDLAARYSAPENPPCSALQRATTPLVAARYSAPQAIAAGAGTPSSGEVPSPPAPIEEEESAVTEVLRAVAGRTRDGAVWGQPKARIAALVAGRDPAPFLTALSRTPPASPIDALVATVELVSSGGLPAGPPAPGPSLGRCGRCGGLDLPRHACGDRSPPPANLRSALRGQIPDPATCENGPDLEGDRP